MQQTVQKLVGIFLIALFAAAPTLSIAQSNAGRVEGVVTSADGTRLEGARVTIGTRSDFTDRTGRYSIDGLAEGTYRVVATFIGGEGTSESVLVVDGGVAQVNLTLPAAIADVEEIVVIAERQLGLNSERASINKKSVLSAARAADLPDINAAEAIQRLPGVYIDEDRGEGRFVSIRGAGSSFNRVKLNGLSVGSPESNGLSVPLDIFPAGAVSTIEVTKSVTPAQDANSVGGEIQLRTPTAFGRDPESNLKLRVGEHDLGGGDRYRVSGDTSFIFGDAGQFAIALNGAYNYRDLLAETVETSDWDLEDNVPGFEGQEVWVADDLELRNQEVERTRITVGGILEWAPSDTSRLYTQVTYSEFEEDELRNRLIIELEDGFDGYDASRPIVVSPPGGGPDEVIVETGGSPTGFPVLTRATFLETEEREIDTQRDLTPQEFSIISFGGEWQQGNWDLFGDLGWSRTTEKRRRTSIDWESVGLFDLDYDASGDALRPTLTNVGSGDPNDPASYEFQDLDFFIDDRIDEFTTLSFDARRAGLWGGRMTLDMGARITLRDREVRDIGTDYNSGDEDLFLSDPRFLRGDVNGAMIDGRYRFGPGTSNAGLALIASDPDALLSFNTSGELGDSYVAEEDVYALYAMGTYRNGRLTLLGGVRVEQTEFEIDGLGEFEIEIEDAGGDTVFEFEDFSPVAGTQSYTDVFPSLHLRYDINENLILRSSVSKTIRRPDFNDLSPEASVEVSARTADVATVDNQSVSFESGNPDLEPLESVNLEVSLDAYSERWGAFGIALFYKDLSNITVENGFETTVSDPSELPPSIQLAAQGMLSGPFTLFTSTLNSEGDGELTGLEISYSKKFVALPAPFDGFGVDANITLVDSEQRSPVLDDDVLVGTIETPLDDQSERSGNVTLVYEKNRFSGRITYAFVDERPLFLSLESADDLITQSVYDLDFARLGAKFRYDLTDTIRLSIEGNNFNDRALRRYRSNRNQGREFERNSWWWEVGVEMRF